MYNLGGPMPFFHLDKEKCKKDGICSAVCVTGIIKNDDERSPYIDEKNTYKCISCGLCVAFCPHEACYVENLDPAQFSKVDRDTLATPEQLDTFIKTRRSVRVFRKNAVDDETINKIMDNVKYAPSAKNTHNNRWIITKSREETVKLGDLVAQYMQEHISEVPEEHALHYKLLCRAYKSGRDVIMRDAPHIVVSVLPDKYDWKAEDGCTALAYFELSAHAHNIGCVWAGYFTSVARVYKPLRDALGLKDDEYIAGAQLFGVPVYKTRQITSRKPNNITYL